MWLIQLIRLWAFSLFLFKTHSDIKLMDFCAREYSAAGFSGNVAASEATVRERTTLLALPCMNRVLEMLYFSCMLHSQLQRNCDKNDPNHSSLCTIYTSELTPYLIPLKKTRPDLPVSRTFLTILVSNMIRVVVDRERVIRIGVYLR